MLVIRAAQLRALALAALGERLVARLPAEDARAAALPTAALRDRVEGALARAAAHGLHDERDLVAFTRLDLLLGAAFDRRPEVAAALDEAGLPPGERLGRVMQALTVGRTRPSQ